MSTQGVAPTLSPAFRARLEQLSIVSRRSHGNPNLGSRRSRRRGASIEFADYRRYSAGDDIRNIDWNVFGRSDRLYVKVREAEEQLAVHVLLDCSLSMSRGRRNKIEYARELAAALGFAALSAGDSLTAQGFSDRLGASTPVIRGARMTTTLLEFLGGLRCAGRTSLAEPLTEYASRRRPTGVLFVISDLLAPGGYQGIGVLAQRGHEVVVLHLLDREDLDPDVGEDVELVDSETGERLLLGEEISLDGYSERLHQWLSETSAFCSRLNVRYAAVETEWSVEDVVLRRLRARGILA